MLKLQKLHIIAGLLLRCRRLNRRASDGLLELQAMDQSSSGALLDVGSNAQEVGGACPLSA